MSIHYKRMQAVLDAGLFNAVRAAAFAPPPRSWWSNHIGGKCYEVGFKRPSALGAESLVFLPSPTTSRDKTYFSVQLWLQIPNVFMRLSDSAREIWLRGFWSQTTLMFDVSKLGQALPPGSTPSERFITDDTIEAVSAELVRELHEVVIPWLANHQTLEALAEAAIYSIHPERAMACYAELNDADALQRTYTTLRTMKANDYPHEIQWLNDEATRYGVTSIVPPPELDPLALGGDQWTTERAWDRCTEPKQPFYICLALNPSVVTPRKRRLLAVAWLDFYRAVDLGDFEAAIRAAEAYADGQITRAQLQAARPRLPAVPPDVYDPDDYDRREILNILDEEADNAQYAADSFVSRVTTHGPNHRFEFKDSDPIVIERLRPAVALVKDIFGNPFHPVTFEDAWRTETVLGIARKIYDEKSFDGMPILADALEEAGCTLAQVLEHCRGDGPHARGCWVLDGVLQMPNPPEQLSVSRRVRHFANRLFVRNPFG